MISRLTTEEKIAGLMISNSFPSLGINPYEWWEEATHGLSPHGGDGTNFAYPITTAASFNRTLWRETGAQVRYYDTTPTPFSFPWPNTKVTPVYLIPSRAHPRSAAKREQG